MNINFSAAPSFSIDEAAIRQKLIQHNILPTQEQAYKVFWGLQDNWWKQVIDGRYHQFGAEVFDKGLHDKEYIEQGYLDSIEKACRYISEHLNEPISFELYKSVHHVACQHFSDKVIDKHMTPHNIDSFRNIKECANLAFKNGYQDWLAARQTVEAKAGSLLRALVQSKEGSLDPDAQKALQVIEELEASWSKTTTNVNSELSQMEQKYNLNENSTVLDMEENQFVINYNCIDKKVLSKTSQAILSNYRQATHELGLRTIQALENPDADKQKIKLQYQQETLKNINTLYSELEWLHPWFDGQGRTDIVTLQFLLTQEGLNPAILEFPYYSSIHSIPDSTNYLQQGIELWKKEVTQLSG